jgi:protein TonB
MLCYNVPKFGDPQPPAADAMIQTDSPTGRRLAGRTSEPPARLGFTLLSVVFHVAALAGLIGLTRALAPLLPAEEPVIEMVFEPLAEASPPEPATEAPSPPAPPQAEEPEPTPPKAAEQEPPPQMAESEPKPPDPASPPTAAAEPPAPVPPVVVPAETPPPKPMQPAKPRPTRPRARPAQAVETIRHPVEPQPMAPADTAALAPSFAPPVDASWQASIAGWLASHKVYPEEARQRGEEGRVVVRFTVDRSGRVLDANLVGGSGSEQLDAKTIALVRSASFPAFPPTMTQGRVTITTSVRYTLR